MKIIKNTLETHIQINRSSVCPFWDCSAIQDIIKDRSKIKTIDLVRISKLGEKPSWSVKRLSYPFDFSADVVLEKVYQKELLREEKIKNILN